MEPPDVCSLQFAVFVFRGRFYLTLFLLREKTTSVAAAAPLPRSSMIHSI